MAAGKEPSDEAISIFEGVTGLPRNDAIRWLKSHSNDANGAINAYFENPNAIFDQQSQVRNDEQRGQVRWNEDQFHAGKTDDVQDGQDQVTVRPADTLRPGVFNDSTPTRPNSRVSTRAATAADTGANQHVTMTSEDEEMSQALALSLEGRPNSDISFSESKAFGPATRLHYETDKWAMTLPGNQAEEIHLNPEAADRKRPDGSPAFLKPSPAGHRLPALLKILHVIPMAREALLNKSCLLPDYGCDSTWWDGTAIKRLRIVNVDREDSDISNDDVIYETQRLMAFLDDTKRAYGSIDALASNDAISRDNSDKIETFFKAWLTATAEAAPNTSVADIFETVGTKITHTEPETTKTIRMPIISPLIDEQISGKGESLYEALDNTLWADQGEGEEIFLDSVGHVLTFEVTNQVASVGGLGIKVPATWYADRYLRSSFGQVQEMLSRKKRLEADLERNERVQAVLTKCSKLRDGEFVDATRLIANATAYFDQTSEYRSAAGNQSSANTIEAFDGPNQNSSTPAKVMEELKLVAERVSQKLKAFEEIRENVREQARQISQIYTKASDDPAEPPYHKYTLRGVSGNPDTVFVLEKTKPEDENDMLSTEAKDWQWWKIAFLINEAQPVVHTKVTEDEVLEAAGGASSSTLLVYASERAMSFPSEELPQQLRNFVRADNLHFSEELEDSSYPNITTPTKRKVTDNDSDDLETHYHRSPPEERIFPDTAYSNDDMEMYPAGSDSSTPPHSPDRAHQAKAYRTADTRSFDNLIPTSLQTNGTGLISASSLKRVDTQMSSKGQEMKQRATGTSLLHHRQGSRGQRDLGAYVPEIKMIDDEEDEDQRGVKGG